MPWHVLAAWWPVHLLNLVVIVLGLMLMLIVLIQRGKGGGLAGAFGGAGGSSPFGSRAADQFVKITLWLAGVWVLVIMIHVKVVKYDIQGRRPIRRSSRGTVDWGRTSREPASARSRHSPTRPTGVLLSMTGFGEARTQTDGAGRGGRSPRAQQPPSEGDRPRHRPLSDVRGGVREGGPPPRPPRNDHRSRPRRTRRRDRPTST